MFSSTRIKRFCATVVTTAMFTSLLPFNTAFGLAPAITAKDLQWGLTPDKRRQAQNLIQVLDLVIPYLESRQAQKTVVSRETWVEEEHRYVFSSKQSGKDESLLPQFRFFNALGIENLRRLKADLEKFSAPGVAVPPLYRITCEKPVGLYRFSRLTRDVRGTGIFRSLGLQFFRRGKGKEPLASIADYDEKGFSAFTFYGEPARAAARVVFPAADKNAAAQKTKLLEETAAARAFCTAIRRHAESPSDDRLEAVRLSGDAFYRKKIDVAAMRNFLKLVAEEEERKVLEELARIREEIEEMLIVIEADRTGEIGYFNLGGWTQEPATDKTAVAIAEIEIDFSALLKWASGLHSHRAIVGGILERLPFPEVGEEGKIPPIGVTATAAALSNAFKAFPPQTFRDPFIFYNLLKILIATRDTFPLYDDAPRPNLYNLELRQNILTALNAGFPEWFREAVAYLDKKIVIGGDEIDPSDTALDFFEASGWIDAKTKSKMLKQPRDAKTFEKVKALLLQGKTATVEALESPREIPVAIAKSFSLKDPVARLAVLGHLKRRLFCAGSAAVGSVTSVGAQLAFLTAEELERLTRATATLGEWIPQIPAQLAGQRVKQRLRGLYGYAFGNEKNSERSSLILFEEVCRNLIRLGAPGTATQIIAFHWLWHLLKQF